MTGCPSVAVVIPVYREVLTAEESRSVSTARRVLRRCEFFQVSPQSLRANVIGGDVVRFSDPFFEGTAGYNRLLLWKPFYEAFGGFDFILICQTDSLVLEDRLHEFVALPLDYVGAPWVLFDRSQGVRLGRAGNGGFSLRRVSAFREVFESRRALHLPRTELEHHFGTQRYFSRVALGRLAFRGAFHRPSSGAELARLWLANEDIFWAFIAPALSPAFRVADPTTGLKFSFEEEPRHCFQQTGGRLPMGCHAWSRYDPEFWATQLPHRHATHEEEAQG